MSKNFFLILLISANALVQANRQEADSIFNVLPQKIAFKCNEEPIKDACQEVAKDMKRCQDFWVQQYLSGKDIEQINSQEFPDLDGHIYQLLQPDEQLSQKEIQDIAELAVKPAVEMINENIRFDNAQKDQELWQQYHQLCKKDNQINGQEVPNLIQPISQSALVQDDDQLIKEQERYHAEDNNSIKTNKRRLDYAIVGTFVCVIFYHHLLKK